MAQLINFTFFLFKPSALRKTGFFFGTRKSDKIKRYIEMKGFRIVAEKIIRPRREDLVIFYGPKHDMIKRTHGKDKANEIVAHDIRILERRPTIIILVYRPDNAIIAANRLVGHSYVPKHCHTSTIRYIFRNKEHDKFDIKPDELKILPEDNLVYTPKSLAQTKHVIDRYFKEEIRHFTEGTGKK